MVLTYRVTYVELVELGMVDFDVILGMDWLHAWFDSIDCRTRVVKFNFPNEPVLQLKGGNFIHRVHIISCLKICKMIYNRCLLYIVRFKDLVFEIPLIESVLVVEEFLKVFPKDIPGIPPE